MWWKAGDRKRAVHQPAATFLLGRPPFCRELFAARSGPDPLTERICPPPRSAWTAHHGWRWTPRRRQPAGRSLG
jgi:hypothetical protein